MAAPGGHMWLLQGGMRGCSRGGMHGCSGEVCVVAPGGHAWLLWGGMCGCSGGACMVAPGGGGGVCMGYDEIWRYDQCILVVMIDDFRCLKDFVNFSSPPDCSNSVVGMILFSA